MKARFEKSFMQEALLKHFWIFDPDIQYKPLLKQAAL